MTTAILALGLASALAQDHTPTITVAPAKGNIVAGGLARIDVKVSIKDGLHAYQNPPSQDYMIPLSIEAGDGTVVEKVKYPKGTMAAVGGETEKAAVYEGDVVVPVYVRLGNQAGHTSVKLKVTIQQCTDANCFPPESKAIEFGLDAGPASGSAVSRKAADIAVLAMRRPH
ncbi:MAG: protein-disulfide reductase DsbD N-terminal domain-containing protein [Fimbriimonadaceae bacterium]|nr:protein-disulfide reductase DsbD N-terminal domain-containing protein [Fimbriimonadaceae bacterium]